MMSRKEGAVHATHVFAVAALFMLFIFGCQGGHETFSRTNSPVSLAAFAPQAGSDRTSRALVAHNPADRADRLTVLSFNMEHRDRPGELRLMADHLRKDLDETPDFILLQEVVFNRDAEQGVDNTAAVLGNFLGYQCEGTKRTSDHEGVAILSRYPFIYYDAINLSSQTSRLLLGFRRVSVMGEFRVQGTGLVRVVNVHFTNWGFETHVRRNQLEETLEWVAQREHKVHADITIFGGDFNCEPDDDALSLMTDARVCGGLHFQNYNTGAPTRGGYGSPNKRVDYLYICSRQNDLKMLGEDRLWAQGLHATPESSAFWLSDHTPLLHEYAVQAGAPTRLVQQPAEKSTALVNQ